MEKVTGLTVQKLSPSVYYWAELTLLIHAIPTFMQALADDKDHIFLDEEADEPLVAANGLDLLPSYFVEYYREHGDDGHSLAFMTAVEKLHNYIEIARLGGALNGRQKALQEILEWFDESLWDTAKADSLKLSDAAKTSHRSFAITCGAIIPPEPPALTDEQKTALVKLHKYLDALAKPSGLPRNKTRLQERFNEERAHFLRQYAETPAQQDSTDPSLDNSKTT